MRHAVGDVVDGLLGDPVQPLHFAGRRRHVDLPAPDTLELLAVEHGAVRRGIGEIQSDRNRRRVALVGFAGNQQIQLRHAERDVLVTVDRHVVGAFGDDFLEHPARFPLDGFGEGEADRQGLLLAAGVLIPHLRGRDRRSVTQSNRQRQIVAGAKAVAIGEEAAARERQQEHPDAERQGHASIDDRQPDWKSSHTDRYTEIHRMFTTHVAIRRN